MCIVANLPKPKVGTYPWDLWVKSRDISIKGQDISIYGQYSQRPLEGQQ